MDEEEHTEPVEEHTEDEPPPKPKTAAEEKLERKRASMERARMARNKNAKDFQKEIEGLKEELKKKEEALRTIPAIAVKEEPISTTSTPKVKAPPKSRQKPVSRYEYEEDDEDDDEDYIEKIIIRKKQPRQKQKQPVDWQMKDTSPSHDSLVEKSYKEQLQAQLNDERRKRVMNDLFDF